jgi:hypothetical protein
VHQLKESANLNPAAASLPRITPRGQQKPHRTRSEKTTVSSLKMAHRIAKQNPRRTVPE